MLLICLGYVYLYAVLNLLNHYQIKNYHVPLVHHTYSGFYLMNLFQASLFYYKYALEYYLNITIKSKHTCIEFGCTYGLTVAELPKLYGPRAPVIV
jgi:hypothetical protein